LASRIARVFKPASSWPIGKDDAVRAAQFEEAARGLPWDAPLSVTREFGNWQIWTNGSVRGGNLRIEVDAGSGDVLAVHGPTPR
jgi:hypothetical protein